MSSEQGFAPRWASPPGETIRDLMASKQLSEHDAAATLGLSSTQLAGLLAGQSRISPTVAEALSSSLGGTVSFWLKRDSQYLLDAARVQAETSKWAQDLPVSDMRRFGWLETHSKSTAGEACLRFFGVRSVEEWDDEWSAGGSRGAAFRTSATYRSNRSAVSAWLRQGELQSQTLACASWSRKGLLESLPELRQISRIHDPTRFLPALQKACAGSGVAVCLVRAPGGCKASGAARFISPSKALIMLSFRYLSDDHFWFTLFHEIGHLILHEGENFLEGEGEVDSLKESEADSFASRTLIPKEYEMGLSSAAKDYDSALRFARTLGIAPGILVGQLQHRGIIGRDRLNKLKRRFSWG